MYVSFQTPPIEAVLMDIESNWFKYGQQQERLELDIAVATVQAARHRQWEAITRDFRIENAQADFAKQLECIDGVDDSGNIVYETPRLGRLKRVGNFAVQLVQLATSAHS